jgi:hypothetical protein
LSIQNDDVDGERVNRMKKQGRGEFRVTKERNSGWWKRILEIYLVDRSLKYVTPT